MGRFITAATLVCLIGATARADTVTLAESAAVGQCSRVKLSMKLSGEMTIVQGGKPATLKLSANAEHQFGERILALGSTGAPTKAARYYDTARATITVDEAANPRTLRADRRLIVAQRQSDALECYCPAGPLTREELETVSEHFDTLALAGLLPGKSVAVGETWKIADSAVQALCQFDGLVSHDLSGKLTAIKDGGAMISIEGSAKGIELGAQASVKITATAKFDVGAKRIVNVEWKQSDIRDQGPASPAVNAQSQVSITRDAAEELKELSDLALVSVPQGMDIPEPLKLLSVHDVKNRFELFVSRDWQVTGQTESHLVLRLIDRGEFVAQATITPFPKAAPGQHLPPAQFRESMMTAPGWTSEQVLQEAEVPNQPAGRYVYRVAAQGQMEGVAVLQVFYLVASPKGDQAVVVVTFKPAQANKLGGREALLIDGLEFEKK